MILEYLGIFRIKIVEIFGCCVGYFNKKETLHATSLHIDF